MSMLNWVPYWCIWGVAAGLIDVIRQSFRMNVEVVIKCFQDVFQFWVPVLSGFMAMLFVCESSRDVDGFWDRGVCLFVLTFGCQLIVNTFLGDCVLSKSRVNKPKQLIYFYTFATAIFYIWYFCMMANFFKLFKNYWLGFSIIGNDISVGSTTMAARTLGPSPAT